MLVHVQATEHKLCGCGGYHYPHRPGSAYCDTNPNATYNLALRAGEPQEVLDEIQIEAAWSGPGRPLRRLSDFDQVIAKLNKAKS